MNEFIVLEATQSQQYTSGFDLPSWSQQATDAGGISDAHDDHDAQATMDVAALGDVLEFVLEVAFGTAPQKAENCVCGKFHTQEAATEQRRRLRIEEHQAITLAFNISH